MARKACDSSCTWQLVSIYFAISNLLSITLPISYNWSPAQYSKGYLAAPPWGSAPAQELGITGHASSSAAEQPQTWESHFRSYRPSLKATKNGFARSMHIPLQLLHPHWGWGLAADAQQPLTGLMLYKHPSNHPFPFQRSPGQHGRWQKLSSGWLPRRKLNYFSSYARFQIVCFQERVGV